MGEAFGRHLDGPPGGERDRCEFREERVTIKHACSLITGNDQDTIRRNGMLCARAFFLAWGGNCGGANYIRAIPKLIEKFEGTRHNFRRPNLAPTFLAPNTWCLLP